MLSVKNRQARKVPGSLVDKTLAFDVTCIHICCCEVLGKLLLPSELCFSTEAKVYGHGAKQCLVKATVFPVVMYDVRVGL